MATSLTLATAIKKIGDYDLIFTGQQAIDGDTGQVGPGIASLLDLPLSTYTRKGPTDGDEQGGTGMLLGCHGVMLSYDTSANPQHQH